MHLIGESGGLPRDVSAAEVPSVVKAVTLKEAFDDSAIAAPGAVIGIPEAAGLGKDSQAGDILAFWGPEGGAVHAAKLAAATPGEGTRVWLAASVVGGAPASERLHGATVVGLVEGKLVYQYDNQNLELQATSGAAVLNSAGEVVAINLGGGKPEGTLLGVGNPVGRFVPFLDAAVKRSGGR